MRLAAIISCMLATNANAHDTEQAGDATQPYAISQIFNKAMSDPGLAGYEMLTLRLDLLPGGVDPAPHRHDADLFVYVLEGSIEVELDGEKSTHDAGAMFHEPRNVVHSLLRNTSEDQPASILALFVIKSGREPVIPVTEN